MRFLTNAGLELQRRADAALDGAQAMGNRFQAFEPARGGQRYRGQLAKGHPPHHPPAVPCRSRLDAQPRPTCSTVRRAPRPWFRRLSRFLPRQTPLGHPALQTVHYAVTRSPSSSLPVQVSPTRSPAALYHRRSVAGRGTTSIRLAAEPRSTQNPAATGLDMECFWALRARSAQRNGAESRGAGENF